MRSTTTRKKHKDRKTKLKPWWNKEIQDTYKKLGAFIKTPHKNMGKISDYTDGTIDRICDILEGKGEQYLRMGKDYRKYTKESKF